MIAWRDRLDHQGTAVERYFTDARGGVSQGPYAGLNLGGHVGDDAEHVRANRSLLAEQIGVPTERLVFMNQVHGADVELVADPAHRTAESSDAIVASVGASGDLALVVLVADCTPVLLADPQAGVIAAVHAGRPGLVHGVVPAAVVRLRELGASDISAAVGPSVCGRCYEVPLPMRAAAGQVSPVACTVSWQGTPAIDVAAGVVDQLGQAGVTQVTWVPGCTRESPDLYSYRRDRRTGRFAGVIVLRNHKR